MKNLALILISLISVNSFAADTLTGIMRMNGKDLKVTVDTNINTAKSVTIEKTVFRIDRINASNIEASNGVATINVYLGDSFYNGVGKMNYAAITQYFKLVNGAELNCNMTTSKAFIAYENKGVVKGNCLNTTTEE